MQKHILAIHAHPDDVEFLAGGTLALLAGAGHQVTIVTMAPGDCGSMEHDAEETAAIRRKEAANAASVIGASYLCAEFRDLAIYNDDPSRRWVTEILRRVRPDAILTSSPVDYMVDHEVTSQLVRDACFCAPVPNFATKASDPAPTLPGIPHLYYMDPVAGVDRDDRPVVADFWVNIASVIETKKSMLVKHESQRNWLLKHHGVDDYILQMERWARLQGERAGVELAEGLRRYKGHPYPQSPLLEQLLSSFVVTRGAA